MNSSKNIGRSRATSRANHVIVQHEEARDFALRAAYLHYLLQPKTKRKQYVAAPKQPGRTNTSIAGLVQEYASGSSSSLKLPHNFATVLLDRMSGVLRGSEPLPGYNDAAVKRSFAEAYTAFSERNFRKTTIDKERKLEPLILMFYSSATKAAQKGAAPEDDSWKLLPDRHLAMFVRLVATIIRDHSHDRPELMTRLHSLEKKLLTNDQNLVGGSDGAGTTVEIVVPLTYDVKDMPLVQIVTRIFGLSLLDVQAEINENRQVWTEEAALRDLKSYQTRLSSDLPGALRSQDFDTDEAFLEWKKSESPHLSQMLLDILTAKPELTKSSTGALGKPLPSRPQSTYSDQTYADLSRALSRSADGSLALDSTPNLASLSLGDSSILAVEETIYTFIPPDPRAFLKYITQHAMTFDGLNSDPDVDYQPLSKQSMDLLTELCVRWRVPQFSRLICLLEVASHKFLDRDLLPEEMDTVFDFIKLPLPEPKKPPHMSHYSTPLPDLPASRWTLHDFAVYQRTLHSLYETLLRELYDLMGQCYDTKPPAIGVILYIMNNHVLDDPCFSPRPDATADFADHLTQQLREQAGETYRQYMEKEISADRNDWQFGNVVKLGKTVIKVCDRIKNRYKKNPEIMGVNPLTILVAEVFPRFEEDANAILLSILDTAAENGVEIDIQDGFDLYKELVAIRRIHSESLPGQPFAFNIEDLLVDFVWRWIRAAEERVEDYIEQAIKQDQFQVRGENADGSARDSERHSVSIIDTFMLFNQTLDAIHQLNWNNDEHRARFMTALSRAFATGIGKYCEIVEQKFTKEMDRPSAEELAAQSQTTQEKWMRYAKDAWNNKDRVEPFQFYPEVSITRRKSGSFLELTIF